MNEKEELKGLAIEGLYWLIKGVVADTEAKRKNAKMKWHRCKRWIASICKIEYSEVQDIFYNTGMDEDAVKIIIQQLNYRYEMG